VDVKSLYKYWPYNVWNPKTIDWLDRSLLSGEVKTGFVFVNGDMVPKAFNHGDADFISRAYTENVDNQFHPSWPMVEQIDAIAVFDHDQIEVAVQQAETKGIEVSNAQVNIDSLDEGILSVNLNASSQNNELLEYVQASPLAKNLSLNETIRIAGKQQIDLDFDVSIKSEVNQAFNPQGVINFSAGQFLTTFFSINEINGPVSLDGYQIKLHDLPAQLNGADVMLDGTILTQSPHGVAVDVNLSGNLSADYLLEVVEQNLPISGQSDWLINIKNDMDELVMTAQSALAGVSIMLPPPLDKVAEESKDLEIKCKLPCQQSLVDINYNNQIKSTLSRVANQYHLTRLQFVTEDTVLATNTALFGGHLEHVDLDQWLTLLAQPTSEAGTGSEQNSPWPVNEINLDIKQLTFMSREFTDISLHIVRLADSYEINIDSESMKGRVILDDDLKQKGIVAEFEHLNWIDATIAVDDTEPESTDSSIPDIHLWAEQFSYAGVPLGAFRMEMRNVADGINFELLSLKSELAEVNISGTWNKAIGDDGFSSFNIVMFSERIADFLQTVGFSAPITNAQTLIEMKAQWAGVPSQFNIANIDGDLNIKIGQGQVLDQQPGFGRVLGLFNLTNLPRRLILDFSDVLADGLLFRSMEGHFVIKSGVANTQDFLIKASSAKIHINGDVGFADQSYAQTITINPQIGKTFPTLGAIAGGPVGAAAGFLVQGLFDKQLKNKNEIIYRVTGTWDDPLIELISDE
ncbi:MAG: YhdP family phospholipid transporter, partial [Marinicella sp.]